MQNFGKRRNKIIVLSLILLIGVIGVNIFRLTTKSRNVTEAKLGYIVDTATPVPPAPTKMATPAATDTDTPVPPSPTVTETLIPPTATPVPPTATPMPVGLPDGFEDRSEQFDWVIVPNFYALMMGWLDTQRAGARLGQVRFILVDGGKAPEPLVKVKSEDSYDLYLGAMYPVDWYNKESLVMASCVGEINDLRCYVSPTFGKAGSAGANICTVAAMAQAIEYWYFAHVEHKTMNLTGDWDWTVYQPLITQNGAVWQSNYLTLR